MDNLTNLKAILHSKRANLYYLEKCRVMQKDGRVLYLTEKKDENFYWNIPIANTTVILLGTGTSITQAAVRMLASAGVLIGFCGGGGTPLFAGAEIEWLTPQSEYRPTEYLQGWLSFWFDEQKRLNVAKNFQIARIHFLQSTWQKDRELIDNGFKDALNALDSSLTKSITQFETALSVNELLLHEAAMTKLLYKTASQTTGLSFTRQHTGGDTANDFLNHGNYLAYGLAATTLWVLGIPHSFAVMHGKTRRGALVFDVADLIKDTLILPFAFICAKQETSEQDFRQLCLQKFTQHKALDYLFTEVKKQSLSKGEQC